MSAECLDRSLSVRVSSQLNGNLVNPYGPLIWFPACALRDLRLPLAAHQLARAFMLITHIFFV